MDGTKEKIMQDFGGRNPKEGIFEDNINLDPDGGCRLYSYGSGQRTSGGRMRKRHIYIYIYTRGVVSKFPD